MTGRTSGVPRQTAPWDQWVRTTTSNTRRSHTRA